MVLSVLAAARSVPVTTRRRTTVSLVVRRGWILVVTMHPWGTCGHLSIPHQHVAHHNQPHIQSIQPISRGHSGLADRGGEQGTVAGPKETKCRTTTDDAQRVAAHAAIALGAC